MCSKCHNSDEMVVLQNCMDTLQSEPGPCSGTCPMSSDNVNQGVGIKVEEVSDMKVEENPEPTTSPLIKTEPAVSCLCVSVYRLLFTWHRYPQFPVFQCVCVCIKLHNVDWIC